MRPVTVSVGPNASSNTASSPVRLDEWATGNAGLQVNITGTVNYTVQQTYDDPNSPTNPVSVANMNWFSSTDTGVVGATAAKQSSYTVVPLFVRILLNSGSGSVSMTVVQSGVAPY